MKAFTTFALLLIITVAGCASAKKQQLTETAIEYRAITRGNQLTVKYKSDTLSWNSGRGMGIGSNYRILTNNEKQVLAELLAQVNFNTLKDLKAPTEARFYDGAMIAGLTIVTKDGTYESSSFDHGKPPAEIADLVNQFLKLTGNGELYGN